MTNIILKENQEINELAMEYKETGNEDVFTELYYAVKPLTHKVAYKKYHALRNKGVSITKEDAVNVAEFTIFDAIKVYDSTKGGSFTAFLKRLIGWKINDQLVKPSMTQQAQFNQQVHSLDKPLTSGEGTMLDAVDHAISSDLESYDPVGADVDVIFDTVVESDEDDKTDSLQAVLMGLVNEFAETVKDEEALIIRTVVDTILSVEGANKKTINSAVEQAMPNTASATVRKKKSRVIKKFNDFAKEQGFGDFDLSQF